LAAASLAVGPDSCVRMLGDESTPKRRVRLRVRGATEFGRMWQRREAKRKFGIKTLAELQHMEIRRVLELTRGNVALTAQLLGIGKTTIYRKIRPKRRGEKRKAMAPWTERKQAISTLRRKLGLKKLRNMQRDAITRVLKVTQGNVLLTAALLGIGKTTVYRVLKISG